MKHKMFKYYILLMLPICFSYTINDQITGFSNQGVSMFPNQGFSMFPNQGVSYWNPFLQYRNLQPSLVFPNELYKFNDGTGLFKGRTGEGEEEVPHHPEEEWAQPPPSYDGTKYPFNFYNHGDKEVSYSIQSPQQQQRPRPQVIKKAPEFKIKLEIPSMFQNRQPVPAPELTAAKKECDKLKGSYVLGECYKFYSTPVKGSLAPYECRVKGGQLWTPNLKDPALLAVLAQEMPQITDTQAAFLPAIWIGANVYGGHIITLEGEDITNDLLANFQCGVPFLIEGGCVNFFIKNGAICTQSLFCDFFLAKLPYVCEFPLKSNKELAFHKFLAG